MSNQVKQKCCKVKNQCESAKKTYQMSELTLLVDDAIHLVAHVHVRSFWITWRLNWARFVEGLELPMVVEEDLHAFGETGREALRVDCHEALPEVGVLLVRLPLPDMLTERGSAEDSAEHFNHHTEASAFVAP